MRDARNQVDVTLRTRDDDAHHADTGRATGDADLKRAYALAIQALRDVRHLLPGDAVAVVDAVLTAPQAESWAQFAPHLVVVEASSFN
jgi:hypothetical protein